MWFGRGLHQPIHTSTGWAGCASRVINDGARRAAGQDRGPQVLHGIKRACSTANAHTSHIAIKKDGPVPYDYNESSRLEGFRFTIWQGLSARLHCRQAGGRHDQRCSHNRLLQGRRGGSRPVEGRTGVSPFGCGPPLADLPPAEVAVHPFEENDRHELHLMCDDVEGAVKKLNALGVACEPFSTQGWGIGTRNRLPGGGTLALYEPRHARP
jgi:hypothetical protein